MPSPVVQHDKESSMGILAGDLVGLVRELSAADLWPGFGRTWSIGPFFTAHRGNGMDQFSKAWLVLRENENGHDRAGGA